MIDQVTAEDRAAEDLLNARIALSKVVDHPREGWQQRYCEAIDRLAKHYKVSSDDLAGAFMRHHGPDITQ